MPSTQSDLPDTTTVFPGSTSTDVEETYDDAAGYYVRGADIHDTKAPGGPLEEMWDTRQFEARIANPANRRPCSSSPR
jgi:succinate dehydrogenase / fumarate reductase flavoprotein subunit